MAFVFDYTFDNSSRIGNDLCFQDQETIQNVNSCNYLLQNYFANDCLMKKPIHLATSQPSVFYNGPSCVGDGGCVVDESSKLLLGSLQTHPKSKLDLFHRPFGTVPYLGRGSVDSVLESQILQGEVLTNKRSVNHLTEISYIKYTNTPLLTNVKDRVTNPAYCVEEESNPNWIRGGIASRELNRDKGTCN
jgi:hypothetical protein